MNEELRQDPLDKALAETEPGQVLQEANEPLASYDSALRAQILVPMWGIWTLCVLLAVLLGSSRQAPLQPIIITLTAFLGLLLFAQFTKKKERFLVYADRVVRKRAKGQLSAPIKEITLKSLRYGLKTTYYLEPREANMPGLLSQDGGQRQTQTVEVLMLLKRLGAKVEAPEWKQDEAIKASAWLVKSCLNDVSPFRLLLGTLIGVSGLAAIISLVVIPILWALIAVCLLSAFGYVCFELIKAIDRGATRKPTGVLFAKDQVAWLQKGKEIWSVKPDDIRRFEISSARGLVSFALVTNYGRRYDLLAVDRNEALRQINGRGYELVWAEKGPEEGRFLP